MALVRMAEVKTAGSDDHIDESIRRQKRGERHVAAADSFRERNEVRSLSLIHISRRSLARGEGADA